MSRHAARRGGRRRPALGAQGILQALRPLDQSVRVLELFDFLAATRKCNDKFVIVAIDLAANLKNTMFNFAAHRRPEHYRLIVERTGAEVTPAND